MPTSNPPANTANTANPPGPKTSELKVTIAAGVLTVLLPILQDAIASHPLSNTHYAWVTPICLSILAGLYSVSRGLSKQNLPPDAQKALIEQAASTATQAALSAITAPTPTPTPIPLFPETSGIAIPGTTIPTPTIPGTPGGRRADDISTPVPVPVQVPPVQAPMLTDFNS